MSVNPALLGFIAGQEGLDKAEEDEKWAIKMARRYGIDPTTILLYAKTYGRRAVEEALKRKK